MKYCEKCGAEMHDEAVICVKCGCEVKNRKVNQNSNEGLDIAIKIFMILSCVAWAFFIIPLAWIIPMTVVASNKMKNNEPIGTGFKICTLIFVNTIAGILLLVRNEK